MSQKLGVSLKAHFFNNYLMDPARPQLPSEPRSPRKSYRSPSPSRETARESSRHDTKTSDRERSDSWNQGSQKWQQYGRIRNDRGGGGRDNLYNNSSYSRPYGGQQYSNFRIPYGGNQRSYYNGPRAGGGYGNFNRFVKLFLLYISFVLLDNLFLLRFMVWCISVRLKFASSIVAYFHWIRGILIAFL
ncbi:unnamed protein product [Trichobilharzia regenti]|nr:unnamed protein product [Trichobilharzia regenti]